MNKKKCPECGSSKTKKNGQRNGVQWYKCTVCNHPFRGGRKVSIDELWEVYMNEYAQWKRMYHDCLNRRTIHKDGKSYYLHRRLRSAMNSLDYYLPYLYTYQRPECEGMPNTNNKIEGTFTNLKKNLNNHSGMSIQNRMRFISGYFTDMLYRMI